MLGAIRLPNTTFKANAGTDVTTDILFLQKRSSETPAAEESLDRSGSIETADGPLQINEYFARHPEMMLGRMGMESGQYGTAPALIGSLEARRPRKGRCHFCQPPCTRTRDTRSAPARQI